MGKWALWLALAGLAWFGWTLWRLGKRRAQAQRRAAESDAARSPGRESESPAPAEPMVRCDYCGLYLPARDAVLGNGQARYCGSAHRDAATRARDGQPR